MNSLQKFNNPEFGTIRSTTINGEPWFVGKDVAQILGYSNTRDAIRIHVDEEDKTDGVVIHDSIGREQTPALINESGLYSLILLSKMPKARQFKRWVTSEVLPSIRKNGGYIAGQETLTDDELLAKALEVAHRKIMERDRQIAMMKPKEIFADAVATSATSILIGDLAKILKGNGVEIGQKRLFQWLRDNGYLIKRQGSDYNSPTQKSMELKLMEIKETAVTCPDGSVRVTKTPKITGKGQQYFINKFLGADDEQRTDE